MVVYYPGFEKFSVVERKEVDDRTLSYYDEVEEKAYAATS